MENWLAIALLCAILSGSILLNTAPAFNLPLVPELFLFSLCLWINGSLVGRTPGQPADARTSLRAIGGLASILVIVTAVRAYLAYQHMQTFDPLCSLQGGLVPQLECLYQAGIEQNASFRLFSYVLVALAIFVSAYRTSQLAPARSYVPVSIAIYVAFFLVLTFWLHSHKQAPPGFFIGQQYAESRFAVLVENPTWIWPLLIPGLISIVFLNLKANRSWARLTFTALGFASVALLVRTQQRGAILASLWTGFWLLFPFMRTLPWKKILHRKALASVFGTALLCGCLIALYRSQLTQIAEHSFLSRYFTEGLHSSRTLMWQLAWDLMDGHWLLGHGYGSWYREFSQKALPLGIEAYDTAHNFFVQMLFELGLLHLLLFLACGAALVYLSIKWSWKNNRILFFTVMHALGLWAMALTLQEIDFVRSTYYSNALIAGWLFGQILPLPQRQQAPRFFRPLRSLGHALALSGMVASLFFLSKISIGGYQFEAHYNSQYKNKVRWLRPRGTLGTFVQTNGASGVYSVHPILAANASKIEVRRYNGDWQEVSLEGPSNEERYLPVPIQKWYQPPLFYRTSGSPAQETRFLSLMIGWPAFRTQLPMTQAQGLLGWEKSVADGFQFRWCTEHCRMSFLRCLKPKEQRVVTLMAARPDIDDSHTLLVDADNHESRKTLEFTGPNQTRDIVLTQSSQLELKVNRTYETADDSRRKGILLLSSDCRNTLDIAQGHHQL